MNLVKLLVDLAKVNLLMKVKVDFLQDKLWVIMMLTDNHLTFYHKIRRILMLLLRVSVMVKPNKLRNYSSKLSLQQLLMKIKLNL